MKVVFVVSSFPKLSETFIVNKFLGLLERGWDVHVVCAKHDQSASLSFPKLARNDQLRSRVHVVLPHRPQWLSALLLPLTCLRCLATSPQRSLRYLFKGWRAFGPAVFRKLYLDAHLITLGPDVIHFEFGALAAARMYLRDLLDCKIVVSFRGYDLNHVGLEDPNHYQGVWEKADAVHLLGQDLWQRAERRGCPQGKRHTLIPPGIDTELFNPAGRCHDEIAGTVDRPLRILSAGRLDWKKGYEYALETIRLLIEHGIHCSYQIVGDGDYLEALAFTRHQLELENIVELCGDHAPAALLGKLAWADVLLHSAVSEGFCNAVLEAQAMCLPVVCTNAGGLPENVVDRETGFVVERRNPRVLAEKLILLAQRPELRQQMGQAGRQRVETHFRLEDQISKFESLYRKVVESQVASPERAREEQGHSIAAAHVLEKR